MTRYRIIIFLAVFLIGEFAVYLLAQSAPRVNPWQVSSFNPSTELFWYVGPAAALPACVTPTNPPTPGVPPLPSLAYITGPPDQIEACMNGTSGPEWVQIGVAK